MVSMESLDPDPSSIALCPSCPPVDMLFAGRQEGPVSMRMRARPSRHDLAAHIAKRTVPSPSCPTRVSCEGRPEA
jgi:hypothetical protein